jgi:hypothetical protein
MVNPPDPGRCAGIGTVSGAKRIETATSGKEHSDDGPVRLPE